MPTNVHCVVATHFLVEPSNFAISNVDQDIYEKSVGEINTELISWHWHGDDKLMLSIVMLISNTSISLIWNATIAGVPASRHNIRDIWVCQEEPNGDGHHHCGTITPITENHSAARCEMEAFQVTTPTLF